MALAGAMQKSIGETSASEYPMILANGFQLCFLMASLFDIIKAEPPSFNFEAFPAVIVPPSLLKTVGNDRNFSSSKFVGSSSSKTPLRGLISFFTQPF